MHLTVRRAGLLFPLVAGAVVLLLYATRPDGRGCDGDLLSDAQHAYLTQVKVAGVATTLLAFGLIWLLARRGRFLRPEPGSRGRSPVDVIAPLGGLVALAGATLWPQLLVPFLLAGLLSVYSVAVPAAAAVMYVAAFNASEERRFVRLSLVLYWLLALLVIPGVFAILALHVAPICLN